MASDAEILRLRRALRGLVALSSMLAARVGRAPPAIAAGLADSGYLLQAFLADVHYFERSRRVCNTLKMR
jgi:hypothetical protein